MLTYLFPDRVYVCPCKGKKGKKAKKKAKGYANDEEEFGEDARSIQDAVASSKQNGGKSICDPANFPSNGDIDLLNNIIDISEAAKNVENRNFINDLYNEYEFNRL